MVKETSSNIKKKRKGGAENDEIDIYKKVVEFEEKESLQRESLSDAIILYELCQEIKETLKEVFYQKSQTTTDATKNKNVFKELQTEIFLKLCIIKKLNRIDKIKHVAGKDTLSIEKQKCDSIKLSYQNLVYELHHLVAETNKCLAFKSKDEDIELVKFEEFMADAPGTLTNKFQKYDPEDREQTHALRLARLEWELKQRKSLAKLCKSLIEEQKKLGQDLVEQKEKLHAIRPLLLNIIKSTKPLQEHLDISLNELRSEDNLASLLSDALYILYVNVVSYNNVYGMNIDIEIIGNEREVIQWKESTEIEESLQNDDDSGQETDIPEVEEVIEVKKRRHRKSVQQVDPMEEKKKVLLESHPLTVAITAALDNGLSISLKFKYQTKLKIVTVQSNVELPANITGNNARDILSGENILGELIDGDTGIVSPNPVTSYQLEKVGIASFQSLTPQIGYAYHWAQRVCGIDFLTKQTNNNKLGSQNIENILKILFRCLKARFDLANQLQQLEQHIIPRIPDSVEVPSSPVSSLVKWSSVTYQKFCQAEFTRLFVEEDLVASSDIYYSVNINRGAATLQAFIVIKNSYPEVAPIFSLCLHYNAQLRHSGNCDEIRDMERMLNLNWEHNDSTSPWLLAAQISHLCSYLDVFLESLDPKSFPRSVTFIRNICARNRKRPFNFKSVGTGIFTQY